MSKIPLLGILLWIVIPVYSQAKDDNIRIQKSVKIFKFEIGNSQNPVIVKETDVRVYTCTKYKASIPVSELFSTVEVLDEVYAKWNGTNRWIYIDPKIEYFNRDGIFFSDEKICYFNFPISTLGAEAEVTFKKTITDPRYLSTIMFVDGFDIEEQQVQIIVPDWMKLDIKEFHFEAFNIQKKVEKQGAETIYTYSLKKVPAFEKEPSSPGITYLAPHVLVQCKSAIVKDQAYEYFTNLSDLYKWYRSLVNQIGNEESGVKEKAEEITKGIVTDEEKVKRIFLWVQENIRYIAFEDGIAGFKPEKAQEVLRKKYGDCKGMANLLTVMLRSLKLDARRCWIGTKHIYYDYSTPSLSVDNHMICVWMKNGKPVFLDATEKYIGYGEIAERIQGRQTLIENGDQYLLERVPVKSSDQNLSIETRQLTIEGNLLKGHVVHVMKGESKEWFLTSLHDIKQERQEDALKQYFSEGENGFEISNIKITNITDYNSDLKIEYDIVWKNAIAIFNKELYLTLDNRVEFKDYTIDTTKRKTPYWLPYKENVIYEVSLDLPSNMVATELPSKVIIHQDGYSFSASYTLEGSKLFYKKKLITNKTEIKTAQFVQWNTDVNQLTNFYNQQVVLTVR